MAPVSGPATARTGGGDGGAGAGGPARQDRVAVWQGRVPFRVHVGGEGPPLVFLHGPWGLGWGPFLGALARRFTVYAPEHPGTTPGEPEPIEHVDSLWDLVLCYDELLDRLGLDRAALVGHSFGGMVACELAAQRPERARRLVLLDPIGLWQDETPVVNWMLEAPLEQAGWVFHSPESPAAGALFAIPEDPEAGALARTRLIWGLGATGKFIWPIPDKGLAKRIHRVTAPTLLVWGRHDRLVPLAYAEAFARRLSGARVEVVEEAGHAPHLERPEATLALVEPFLA